MKKLLIGCLFLLLAVPAYAANTMKCDLIDTKENIYSCKATATTAAIAETLAPGVAFELKELRIELDAAGGAGDLTITMDNDYGATYDVVILTQDMTAVTNLRVVYTDNESRFKADDELDIAWANANNKDYGLEIIYRIY